MRHNTPPPMTPVEDDSDDDVPFDEDDIEIIENAEILDDDSDVAIDSEGENWQEDDRLSYVEEAHGFFQEHKSSVFCCAIDTNNKLVVSGGEDDCAYVWDIDTQEVILNCTGHTDSVTCIGFNHDSSLLATGDMKGNIKVWSLNEKKVVWDFETADLTWLEWHKGANILLAATAEGDAWMWLVPNGITKSFASFGSSVTAGKVLPDGKRMVLGYDDGTIRYWDLKEVSAIHSLTGPLAHSHSVTTIACNSNNSLVLTGSEDGTVKLINSLNGKVLTTLEVDGSSIESVIFSPRSCLVAVGSLDGTLLIYDTSNQSVRHKSQDQEGAVVKMVWHPSEEKFITARLCGRIYLVDARTGTKEERWEGHSKDLLDMALTSDGKKVVTACEDTMCRVFEITT